MQRIFPLLLILLIGCSSNDVPFNKKTTVSFNDFGFDYKLAVTVDSLPGGISILVENIGTEEFSFDGRDMFFEDGSRNTLRAVNTFVTRGYSNRFGGYSILKILSGKSDVIGIFAPAEARFIIVKNVDHNKTYFKVALK